MSLQNSWGTDPVRFDFGSLARALALEDDRFLVWKGARALDVQGDLDGAAPGAAWHGLAEAFRAWTQDHGMTTTISCAHSVGTLVLVGCGGAAGRRLLQLDLVDRMLVHGVSVWTATQLATRSMHVDGVTTLSPGAEGVARVLASRRDESGPALIRADPDGARMLSRVLGLRGMLALQNRALARTALEVTLAARALASPRQVARAVRTDAGRNACPVLHALAAERTLPDLPDWVARVSHDHVVTTVA